MPYVILILIPHNSNIAYRVLMRCLRPERLVGRVRSVNTPIRRLEGITYWVVEDPDAIYDLINSEVRKEWEEDARSDSRLD
jgi:hypothetical protein